MIYAHGDMTMKFEIEPTSAPGGGHPGSVANLRGRRTHGDSRRQKVIARAGEAIAGHLEAPGVAREPLAGFELERPVVEV